MKYIIKEGETLDEIASNENLEECQECGELWEVGDLGNDSICPDCLRYGEE